MRECGSLLTAEDIWKQNCCCARQTYEMQSGIFLWEMYNGARAGSSRQESVMPRRVLSNRTMLNTKRHMIKLIPMLMPAVDIENRITDPEAAMTICATAAANCGVPIRCANVWAAT